MKTKKQKQKNIIFIDNQKETGEMVIMLCNNGYKVKVEQTIGVTFCSEYKLTFKRNEEFEEV